MEFNLLAAVAWWKTGLAILFILVCFLMIIIVLLQKGRGGGLAGAFGGAGGQSAFGSKTGDVFTVVTICFAVVFLFLAVLLSLTYTGDDYQPVSTQIGPDDTTTPEGDLPVVPGENTGQPFQASPGGDSSLPQNPDDSPQSASQEGS